MIKNHTFDFPLTISISLFLVLTIYWIITQFVPSLNTHHQIYSFSTIYGIEAVCGTFFGLLIAKQWGGMKSTIGMAIIMFSLGLFAQEFGQLVYSYYYIVLHLQSADYPSLGDIGFFGSIPLYCAGIILLGKAAGAKGKLKSFKLTTLSLGITLLMLIVGYVLFLQKYTFDWSNPIKIFLDFGYPLGEAIYISLAISTYFLSRGVLGGIMKNKILFILFALLIQFLADYVFLYQTNNNTWIDGGINDFMYLIAYFLMSLGLIQFYHVLKKLRSIK